MRTVSGRLRRLEQQSADAVTEWLRMLSNAELEELARGGPGDVDLNELTNEQLDALIEGKPVAQVLAMPNPAVEKHG